MTSDGDRWQAVCKQCEPKDQQPDDHEHHRTKRKHTRFGAKIDATVHNTVAHRTLEPAEVVPVQQ